MVMEGHGISSPQIRCEKIIESSLRWGWVVIFRTWDILILLTGILCIAKLSSINCRADVFYVTHSVCEYRRKVREDYRFCTLQSAGSLSTWVMKYIDKTNLLEGNESTLRLFTEITYFLILSDKTSTNHFSVKLRSLLFTI